MLKKQTFIRPVLLCCSLICFKSISPACARTIASFPAGQGGWQLGTLAVGDLDGDSKPEFVLPYRDTSGPRTVWFLDAFNGKGDRMPGFPYAGGEEAINVSPTLFDLDGDGRAEILFTHGNRIVALRGDGTTLWSTTISSQNYVPDAGYQVVTNGFYWSAGGQWRDHLPETAGFFSEVSSPIVGEVDASGHRKVLTAWKVLPDATSNAQDFNPFIKPLFGFDEWGTVGDVWSGGVVFCDALSGQKDFIYHIHQLVESGLGLGRARSGDAPLVYVLNDSDSVVAFDKTKPYGLWGKGMLHKKFGKNQRLQSGSYLKGVDVYPVDLDGDGEDELLVPTTQLDPLWQPSETILDDDGAILWRKWKEPVSIPVVNGWLNNACMIPVNPDHDNRIDVLSFTHSPEIAFRSWNGVDLVDRPGWPKSFAPELPTPPVVGDVDGDGEEEIVIGTYDPGAIPSHGRLYVFALDGREKLSLDVPGGLKHIPALVDADGDGSLDVVFRGLDGTVHIENFGATSTNHVSWATHRGSMARDGRRGAALFPPGTPLVTRKESGYRRTRFSWRPPDGFTPHAFEIYRSDGPEEPFRSLGRVAAEVNTYTDSGLRDGWQYFYEVRAIYETSTVASSPFAILAMLENNLVANGGFEENDNSHWDKWFTGKIPWQNMVGCTNQPFGGRQCMEIRLEGHGSNSSIKQANQYGTPDAAILTSPGKFYSFGGWMRSGGLSQPSDHWLEWNTTRTGENTNDVPPAPWPVYFTPHLRMGTEPIPWTYMNRVFTMPEGFPNVELRHRFDVSGTATGSIFLDNVFFRELPPPTDPHWQTLVPFGGKWKYTVDAPAAEWMTEAFDDGSWNEGVAKFGSGTGVRDIVTPIPWMKPAYYFRRSFTAPIGIRNELLLAATATDDFNGQLYPLRIFLNGEELATSSLDAVSGDGNTVRYFDLHPFLDRVRPGVNTLAVTVQNGWASDWDNVAFDLSLQALPGPEDIASARFRSIQVEPGGTVHLNITGSSGSHWRMQSIETNQGNSFWRTVQSFSLGPEGQVTISDDGQNGRFPPSQAPARLYRLLAE